MKRNEMIDKIQLFLEETSNDNISYRFKAILLLEMIEKAGMSPPPYDPYPGSDHGAQFRAWEPYEG